MKIKKRYGCFIIIIGFLYSIYSLGSYLIDLSIFQDAKFQGRDSSTGIYLISNYFKQYPDIGSYHFIRSERQNIDGKDPGLDGKDGWEIFFFQHKNPSSKELEEIKIKFTYFDDIGKINNIKKTYDSICNENKFDNCTPILIDEAILNHPEILQIIINTLKTPCKDGAINYFDKEIHPQYDGCKNAQDKFGKFLLGLVNDRKELTSVILIIRDNMYGKFIWH